MEYEPCPVCGKKGWHIEKDLGPIQWFRRWTCRYCRSWLTTDKWSITRREWIPIENPPIRRGRNAPKE